MLFFSLPSLKVAISVTPLLALVTQQMQINAEINVSYVVALHIWMMIQIFFVFMSLIEYVFAIVYVHLVEEKKEVSFGLIINHFYCWPIWFIDQLILIPISFLFHTNSISGQPLIVYSVPPIPIKLAMQSNWRWIKFMVQLIGSRIHWIGTKLIMLQGSYFH